MASSSDPACAALYHDECIGDLGIRKRGLVASALGVATAGGQRRGRRVDGVVGPMPFGDSELEDGGQPLAHLRTGFALRIPERLEGGNALGAGDLVDPHADEGGGMRVERVADPRRVPAASPA